MSIQPQTQLLLYGRAPFEEGGPFVGRVRPAHLDWLDAWNFIRLADYSQPVGQVIIRLGIVASRPEAQS